MPRQAAALTRKGVRRVLDFKSVRPIDAAIAAIAALVLGLGIYLGYSVWAQNRSVREATPASRAIESITAQIRKNPNDVNLRMELAQAFAVGGRDREAIEQYQAVLKLKADFVPALSGLGFIALKNKEYATGERYYRKIVGLLEGNVGPGRDAQLEIAYFYLGNALMEQKQYEEAASYFKEALRIKRDASDTHYLLAVSFRELGSMDSYRESLENTLLFDPRHPEANLDLGELLLKEGNIAAAAERFRTSADAAPTAQQPRDALAKLGTVSARISKARRLLKTDPKKAVVEARVAVALDPQSAPAYVVLGDAWLASERAERAKAAYEKALDLDKGNAAAKAGLERVKNGS